MAKAGHTFLAELGKKRLRPGGKLATDWLINQGNFSADKKVLEVACNMGTTTIELAKTFGCRITAIDLDSKALEKALSNAKKSGVDNLITFEKANAMELPYEDNSFDIVINEAMLTMQNLQGKDKCLSEYYRVLKDGGVLLTHDVKLRENDENLCRELSKAINVSVYPLTLERWSDLAYSHQFSKVETLIGEMTLMSPRGMIYDEGFGDTIKIVKNAFKRENRPQFFTMFKTFKKNKYNLGFIAMASYK